jgi:hypothetical protein
VSVEIRAQIICDGCGAKIEGPVQRRTSKGDKSYWACKLMIKREGWITLGRYGSSRHYCKLCSDSGTITSAPLTLKDDSVKEYFKAKYGDKVQFLGFVK